VILSESNGQRKRVPTKDTKKDERNLTAKYAKSAKKDASRNVRINNEMEKVSEELLAVKMRLR
jgi:hypothetical protein